MAHPESKNQITNREHPLYVTWKLMRQRCYNKNLVAYKDYGGRGIKISKDWDNFWNFVKDMGEKPDGYSLDRIDNNGDYCKENCKWSTCKEQAINRRNTKLVSYMNNSLTLTDWAVILGVKRSTLGQRFYVYKWPLEKVFKEIKV